MPPTFGVWYDFRQPTLDNYDRFYAECLDEIVAAEELGYTHCWLSEHHFVEDGYLPSQHVMAAMIAGRTRTMMVGTNVLLLPLYHPLRVAEDSAVLQLASNGRFILGVGGGYVDFEFEAMGVNRKFRPSLLEEGVKIIRQCWEEGRIGFSGKRWSFPDRPFSPRPTSRIPIFFGANSKPGIERAVALGDGYLTAAGGSIQGVVEQYNTVRALAGDKPFPFYVGAWCYVNEDAEQAWKDVESCLNYQMSRYIDWGTDRDQPRPAPFEAKRENYPLVGTPEQVAGAVRELYARVPFDHFCLWGRLPGITHAQALRSAELFSQHVARGFEGPSP
jgi:alkanesulfonate monooxygenase SsuD/methylene tetrahydromethanopterin reductase-like flavin-dependent oxidoreductase (luciferase family)